MLFFKIFIKTFFKIDRSKKREGLYFRDQIKLGKTQKLKKFDSDLSEFFLKKISRLKIDFFLKVS